MTIRMKMITFLVLVALLLLAVVGLGIRNIHYVSNKTRSGLEIVLTETAVTNAIEAAHLHFKIQVQEWKNILMRGSDANSYKQHFTQFHRESQIVQNQLKITLQLLNKIGLSTVAAEQLKSQHDALTNKYINTLQQFKLSEPNDGYQIDRQVVGIDRGVSEGIAALAYMIEAHFYQQVKTEITTVTTFAEYTRWEFILMAGAGLIIASLLSVYFLRDLLRQLGGEPAEIVRIANRIANDDLELEIVVRYNQKTSVLAAIKNMQQELKTHIAEAQHVAAENQRVRFALDNVTVPVTVSDDQHRLVYFNHAAAQLWTGIAERRTPGRDVKALLGERLSNYFEDETTRAAYRTELSVTRSLDTVLAQRHLRVTVSPVRTDAGGYQGRVTQWLDRTAEVTAEQEIACVIAAASNGNFSPRLTTADKQGFFLEVATRVNVLLTIVAQGLEDVGKVLQALAGGDLTRRMTGTHVGVFGQLQDDTNATVDCLRDLITQITETTGVVSSAAHDIAAGNNHLASRTEEQASNLQETVASMKTLTTAVQHNADNAMQANNITRHANDIVRQGGDMVDSVIATMGTIQLSSTKIADIISVIDSIAFQTNILALNAAVEAARAGELGRGFAVVAAEVRNLAQRSAQAAKETKLLIDDSVGRINEGVHQVEATGRTMAELVVNFREVATLITDISTASRQQSADIAQMMHSIGQTDAVTQQNAALVEQAAAAAESLSEQARTLSEIVSIFQLPRAA